MPTLEPQISRRAFLAASAAATAATFASLPSAHAQPVNPRLGMDNFAVRAMGWKGRALVDYAASLALDTLFITDLDAFGSLDEADLKALRAYAEARRVQIQAGTWSICPTSKAFKANWGSAEEHLALGIRVARAVGSPVIRVVLGTWEDRLTDGGIDKHIEQVVRVCRAARAQAVDAGVKIAVENHAGDLHSTELAALVEAAGTDYVGVNLDSGNALWTLEDPIDCLETLARYTLSTSLRDSAVWMSDNGARVAWTAMGEGTIDQRAFFARFRELCPAVRVNIETISGFSRELAYLEPEFWKAWPRMPARTFARFEALARRGHAVPPWQPAAGQDKTTAEQAYQRGELERSVRYCRHELGLGRKMKMG